ncbi:uncharacterized protein LOC127153304 isoform X1 [Labeo rohita]|uniref:uncharacterized protein LOC127153304 isoform X1 n=1 Tax=Labeo rohita TaxID=84645 RepID=UPI0021E1D957|nr:uncharacterized protein LOC127153304 isoform X1 [Labeo rohita]
MKKMFQICAFCCLFCFQLIGVFADDEVKSVSVMEGKSVTLNISVTEIKSITMIMWKFGSNESLIAKISKFSKITVYDNRLKLDNQTGSLTITNINTIDSGLYKAFITCSSCKKTTHTFNVTVYACLPVPNITRDCSSSSSSCSLLCSVVKVSHVTLSWYKGNSLLSSIRVSDLSISLSLLEADIFSGIPRVTGIPRDGKQNQ